MFHNIAIIGSGGAIGSAFVKQLANTHPLATIHTFSRAGTESPFSNVLAHQIDYENESSIKESARIASESAPLDLVIVTTGILHNDTNMPEKSLQELSAEKFRKLFEANSILPALIGKHFLPTLNKTTPSLFAVLSARVGSISDNRLGGWYAYRASKAALNMIIKNAAIETRRRNKQAIVVSLHPGTVDSDLSKPFQANVPEGKLFTPDFSAQKLLHVLENLNPEQSGKCFAWDGQEIEP